MEPFVFLYFEGESNYWSAIDRRQLSKVKYSYVIQAFLKKVEEALNIAYNMNDVFAFILDDYAICPKVISNFDALLSEVIDGNLEILVKPKESKQVAPKRQITPQKANFYIEEGKKFEKMGDYSTAVTFYEFASTYGLSELYKAYYQIKKWKSFEEMITKFVSLHPNHEEAGVLLNRYLVKTQKYDIAKKRFHKMIVKKSSYNPIVFNELFKINIFTGDHLTTSHFLNPLLSNGEIDPGFIFNYGLYCLENKQVFNAIYCAMIHPKCYKLFSFIARRSDGSIDLANLFSFQKCGESVTPVLSRVLYRYGCRTEALYFLYKRFLSSINMYSSTFRYLYYLFIEGKKNSFLEAVNYFIDSNRSNHSSPIDVTELQRLFNSLGSYDEFSLKSDIIQPFSHESQSKITYSIGFIQVICLYLFCNGFINESNIIRESLRTTMYEIDYNDKELVLTQQMYQLTDHKVPFKAIKGQYGKILAFGDISVLSIVPNPIQTSKEVLYFETIPLPGFCLYELVKLKNAGLKDRIYEMIENIQKYNAVIMCFGTVDCETTIPMLMKKCKYSSFKEAINDIVQQYFSFITLIASKFLFGPVIIHPAFSRSEVVAPMIAHFNRALKEKIDKHYIYLDVFQTKDKEVVISTQTNTKGVLYNEILSQQIKNAIDSHYSRS